MTAAAMAAATVAALPAPHAHPPFVPHLSYMEGQFATHALILEQQRRIKTLEAELEAARSEIAQLRSSSLQSACAASSGGIGVDGQHSNAKTPGLPNCQRPPTEDPKKGSSRYWTAEEHSRFLEGLKLFGQKDIKSISRHVGTRSATQVRTHAQKYYLRIERERAKADGTTVPTGTIIARERRCNQKGRPRSRGNATSGGSLSAESAGGEAGTSTNNGSSCTGDVQERSGGRKLESPDIDFKFVEDGRSAVDFKDESVVGTGKESQTERCEIWKVQTDRKVHGSEDRETLSSAKGVTVKIAKVERDNTPGEGYDIGTSTDVCAHKESGDSAIIPDRQRLTNETRKMKLEDKLLQVPDALTHVAKDVKDQSEEIEPEDCKVSKCDLSEDSRRVQTGVEIGKRKTTVVGETLRQARKRLKSIQRVAAESTEEVSKTDFDESGTATYEAGPEKESRDGGSSPEKNGLLRKRVVSAEKDIQSSHTNAEDECKPNNEGNKVLNETDANLDARPHIVVSSRDLNTPLHSIDPDGVTWSSQLPPRGGIERGQIMGLLESGGSATNLRSLLQLPGTDSGFGMKAMTLRRNGSSNSVLADLPKHSGFLSRSNSFLISNNGKGVTRSSSILSLLSGLPTTMRESASSDRLLGLDSSNPDVQGADDDDCADFGDNSAVHSRLISTSLLGRVNGLGSDGSLGDRCLSFGQLHHMGVDDLEDAGAVALSLSDDAERWAAGTADGDSNRGRSR